MTHLFGQLVSHDSFGIRYIQVGQVDQYLPHAFVENDSVALLHELPDDLSFIVLDDEDLAVQLYPGAETNLFWLDHLFDHHQSQIR